MTARALAALALAALVGACARDAPPPGEGTRLSLSETLAGADTAGYARATEVRAFAFPEDHGPHPEFRTEWWYVTGNLEAGDGRPFGFQLTFFRNALRPDEPASPSAWATRQAYMAHFAVTDPDAGRFHAFERFARGAAGLAGAEGPPALRVWLDHWSLTGSGDADAYPLRIRASEGEVALDLQLRPIKPPLLQGERGLSQKGPEPGNASYYYSLTRLEASGTLAVGDGPVDVGGEAWLDREWSTSALSGDQVGWDWFSLQLDDGWELMLYRLRHADGSADPLSEIVLVDPRGAGHRLRWDADLVFEETGAWRADDGATYPAGWRLRIPERGWDLRVRPALADQELRMAFRYWEGAVRVEGAGEGGGTVTGRGYVELTGYAGEPRRR